jgi:hypothetical protein
MIKDLSAVQRGTPIARLFLVFYSYGATVFNSTREVGARTRWSSPSSVGIFLGHFALLYTMPALATTVLARAFRGAGGDDDNLEEFVVDAGREMLSTAMNTMMYLRELTVLVGEGTRGYEGPAGTRAIQTLTRLGQQIKQLELDEALEKQLFAAAGILFRFPASQVQRTIDGIAALEEGETSNPAAILFGPPREAQK